MPSFYDFAYFALLAVGSPILLVRRSLRDKLRDALRTRNGIVPPRAGESKCVLVHAVSVGELNAARALIDELRTSSPPTHVAVTTTTATGLARANELFANQPGVSVARFPLDFSRFVDRLLDAVRPDVVILMELEVWPNFMRACSRRKIPVIVGNGRITEPSTKRYRLLGPITTGMFARLDRALVQDSLYAARFESLGVPRERIEVVGSMKFDAAPIADSIDGADELAAHLGIDRGRTRLIVAGSTGPGEEQIVLDAFDALAREYSDLALMIAPRKPERFDEVAALIERRGRRQARRSEKSPAKSDVFLLDTMGELRKAYALAEIVFVGRSLVDLGAKQHGSDMIEPAALGKPVVVGPFTGNFAEPMRAFREAGSMLEIDSPAKLRDALRSLLADRSHSTELGRRAREVVLTQRGSTGRHVKCIHDLLARHVAPQ